MYIIEKDKIIVSKTELNPQKTLECGQVFSYKKIDDKTYIVYSADKMATLKETNSCVEILTKDVEYFINYFDLNTCYQNIENRLKQEYPNFIKAFEFGSGIHILKQDYFETIISFIVSANNNIKRIQKILFAIREKFGTKKDGFYAFPTAKKLSKATEQDFASLGAGYRAKYLETATKQLLDVNYKTISQLSTIELNKWLLSIMGVGPKVADCIMLFAFSKCDVFPVDTWIEKVYCTYFNEEHNRTKIRQNLLNTFKNNSGYVQQYLFYAQRSRKNNALLDSICHK